MTDLVSLLAVCIDIRNKKIIIKQDNLQCVVQRVYSPPSLVLKVNWISCYGSAVKNDFIIFRILDLDLLTF